MAQTLASFSAARVQGADCAKLKAQSGVLGFIGRLAMVTDQHFGARVRDHWSRWQWPSWRAGGMTFSHHGQRTCLCSAGRALAEQHQPANKQKQNSVSFASPLAQSLLFAHLVRRANRQFTIMNISGGHLADSLASARIEPIERSGIGSAGFHWACKPASRPSGPIRPLCFDGAEIQSATRVRPRRGGGGRGRGGEAECKRVIE